MKSAPRSLLPFYLNVHVAGVFALLYAPLLMLSLYSFNSGRLALRWEGFSLQWYSKALSNPDVRMAMLNSLAIGVFSALGASILGTAWALGVERGSRRLKRVSEGLAYIPLLMPELILGLGLLILFSRLLRPSLAPLHLSIDSFLSVVLGHITLAASYVFVSVRAQLRHYDRYTEWAARDLGAGTRTILTRILLPQLSPAIASGFWMAFSLSLDDFYISYFVTVGGSGFKTVPLYLWSLQGRSALTPELNAISVLMLLVSLSSMLLASFIAKGSPFSRSACKRSRIKTTADLPSSSREF